MLGCATYEYYRNSNIAMLTYLVTRPEYKKLGLAKRLTQLARPALEAV